MGLCQYVTFAFMHPPYLVCILFGMPSLHLFTFLMFFISCFYTFFGVNLSYSYTQVKEEYSFKCMSNHNPRI